MGHVQEEHDEEHDEEEDAYKSSTPYSMRHALNDVGGRGRAQSPLGRDSAVSPPATPPLATPPLATAQPTPGAPERWLNEGGGGRCTRGRGTESGLVARSVGGMYYWRRQSHHCLKGDRAAEECGMLQDDLLWETQMRNCTAVYEILRHKCAEERHLIFFLFMSVELTLSKITELTLHNLCRRPSGVSRRNKSRRGLSH
jgi:hypothetical protein